MNLRRIASSARYGTTSAAARQTTGAAPMFAAPASLLRLGTFARPALLALALLFAVSTATTARAQCTPGVVRGIDVPGTNGDVYALNLLPSGEVLVAGQFSMADGAVANRFAFYNRDGGIWTTVPGGINLGFAVFAGVGLPGGDIVLGGQFTEAGGTPLSNIGRYTTATGWSAMGGGTDGPVTALAVLPSGDLIVGGSFVTAGGTPANSIARFNPTTNAWSALGAGINGLVLALAVLPGGDVLVGGNFNMAGGEEMFNVARYNPATSLWSPLGEGTNGAVNAVATLPAGDFIIAGQFTQAGGFSGVAASNIARYNPGTGVWSALGFGTNNAVRALTVLSSGQVFVGGSFTMAGGQARSYIARYNPATNAWSTLASVASAAVYALTQLPGGDVILGGAFSGHISRYYPGPQAPSIAGQPLPVVTCASGAAMFRVTASGAPGTGTPTYRWRKGGVDIDAVANPSAATPTLSLTNVQTPDAGSYDCRITNACGGLSTLSNSAALSIIGGGGCVADVDDGTSTGTPDGGVTIDDLLYFLFRYGRGC